MPPKVRRPAGVLAAGAKAAARVGAKAKAKPGAKPKARPKGKAKARVRRGRARDRGAPADGGAGLGGVFNREDFLKGAEVRACEVPLEEWKKGTRLVATEATYWEEKLQLAGVLEKVEFDGEIKTGWWTLQGTSGEGLVRWKGKFPGVPLEVHFCHPDCGKVSKDGLAHCEKLKLLRPEDEEPWMKNLIGMEPPGDADELASLRRRSGEVGLGGEPKERKKKAEGSSGGEDTTEDEKGKKAKKKKKQKKNQKSSKEKKKVNGTKSLSEVFGSTGLDPDPEVRKRVLKRAKRLAKKKGRRSSSSSSTRTTEESSLSGEGGTSVIFGQEVRVKSIWVKMPGALTGATLHQMQAALVQQSGQPWEVDRKALPPIFTQYWKMVLDGKSTRPMSREMNTLAFILDLMLQGRAASAADVATQRLKSLEQVAGGGDFRIAQRQELVPLEHQSMSSVSETLEASRLQREEQKARAASTSGKGLWERSKGKNDGDYWDKGRGKKGDNQKGKGKSKKGDGKKGDHRQEEREKKGD